MNSAWTRNIIRLVIIALIQVVLLKRVYLGWENFNYISVIVYPLIIVLLPIRTPKMMLLGIGFLLGMFIDLFYDSPGVHTSATVLIAFIRPFVLQMLEPRGVYALQASPTKFSFGNNWFFTYSGIILFIHLLFYFSVEVFTFVYFFEILLKAIFSFIVSFLIIILYVFLINPKD